MRKVIFAAVAVGGILWVETESELPLLSITIGDRINLAAFGLVTAAEIETYGLSHASAITSPKRFST